MSELLYLDFLKRNDELVHAPYSLEQEFYMYIKDGNVERVREKCEESPFILKDGLGILASTPLQSMKYHFAITAALTARYCIEGGMPLSTSYGVSDYYIQLADQCQTLNDLAKLHPLMCLDYAKRMKNLRKDKICSKHIAKIIDYIYEHLHTRITVSDLAKLVNLSDEYLSRLFKDEIGAGISSFIQETKIETASNMLIYSDYSILDISLSLAFPSQSYFCEVFKKKTGISPKEYRKLHFRNVTGKNQKTTL